MNLVLLCSDRKGHHGCLVQWAENGHDGENHSTLWGLKTFILILKLCVFGLDCPQGEFVDDGTETHFMVGEHECCIKALSSGKKKNGIVHYLLLDGEKIPASTQ